MRTIKFRGLRTDGKGWAYGSLLTPHDGNPSTFIVMSNGCEVEVRPESFGQFTGLTDRNGVEIYDGDIVTWNDGTDKRIAEVTQLEGEIGFKVTSDSPSSENGYVFRFGVFYYKPTNKHITITGNTHEQ